MGGQAVLATENMTSLLLKCQAPLNYYRYEESGDPKPSVGMVARKVRCAGRSTERSRLIRLQPRFGRGVRIETAGPERDGDHRRQRNISRMERDQRRGTCNIVGYFSP